MKKLFTYLLAVIMVVTMFTMPVGAASVETIVLEGQSYQVTQTIIDGKTQVTVVGGGETTVVTNNNDNTLTVDTYELRTRKMISSQLISIVPEPIAPESRFTQSASTPFWNYKYSVDDSYVNTNGLFWNLTSGEYGRKTGFDYDNSTKRNYCENFRSSVLDIKNQQTAAIAAIGTAAASAIAGAITAATGVGAIAGIVLAIGGSLTSAAFWVAAYSSSLDANYNFNRISF